MYTMKNIKVVNFEGNLHISLAKLKFIITNVAQFLVTKKNL